MNEFKNINIKDIFIKKLSKRSITTPTKIQEEIIPKILNGKDTVVQSKTGTGKTLAYLLPLMQNLLDKNDKILIIAPTKELAAQIFNEIQYYSENLSIISLLLISGESIDSQTQTLKNNFDIIVCVPGRLLKLVESGKLKLSLIKKLVLDEADFLIELGFINDIKKIYELCKNLNQFMVFSATLTEKTKKIVDLLNTNRKQIEFNSKSELPENIKNFFITVEDDKKESVLFDLLKCINPYLCVIFVRTKEESYYLYSKLKENSFQVNYLNGDLSPNKRKRAIKDFKEGKIQYLIATDLASRGLDVEAVTHIINYSLPLNKHDYLHRAGRTGRMYDDGVVYSICNELDEGYLKKYAYYLNFLLKPIKIKNNEVIEDNRYKGVKPRFNLNELKTIQSMKVRTKNAGKKNRSKKRK